MNKGNGINVELGKGFIPVKIGGMDFKLNTSDSVYRKYRSTLGSLEKEYKSMSKEMDEMAKSGDYEAEMAIFEKAKDICRKSTDIILGDGTFDTLFDAAGGDTEAVIEAVFEVSEQYQQMKQKSKLSNLVKGKKK